MTNQLQTEIRNKLELGQALERLLNNPDFDTVITQGYVEKVLLERSGEVISADGMARQQVIEQIMSVGYFKQYLNDTMSDAIDARRTEAEAEVE